MTNRRERPGVLLLVIAGALVTGIAVVSAVIGTRPPGALDRMILPAVAIALGTLALAAGHVSYPRVQNLQVYLAGYSIGLQSVVAGLTIGLTSLLAEPIIDIPAGFRELVYLLALVVVAGCSLVPPFPTYRVTRATTLAFAAAQLAILTTALVAPGPVRGWLVQLVPTSIASYPALAAGVLTVGVVLVNAVRRSPGFHLSGAFSGLALIAGAAWVLPPFFSAVERPAAPDLIALLYAGTAPLFLSASTLLHILARMEHRVSYDPLLLIYNRQYCNQILAEQSSVVTRPPLSIMMVDIDHFKQVNDTHGHQAGDRILHAVAQKVRKSVVPEGVVCRYGGEELIVFFPGRSARDIVPLAQRMRAGIEEMETAVRSDRVRVTVSIGISDRRSPACSLEHVVNAADKALYIAKENGRNQVRIVRVREAGQGVTARKPPKPLRQARQSRPRTARSGN